MLNVVRSLQNQYVTAFAGGMTMLMAGACFVWVSPVLPYLEGPDALIPMTSTEISWMVSLIEFGAVLAPVITGIISERWGRKPGILIAGPFVITGWILVLITRDHYSLYVVRMIHGFGIGALFTIVPIYLGEIAAVKVRGGITSLLQTMWYTGFLFQYNMGSYLSYDNSAWVNLIISTIAFLFFYFISPETPYFLMVKTKEKEASRSLILLRGKNNQDEVTSELQLIKECIDKDVKNKFKWTDIFYLSSVDYKIIILVQLISVFRLCSGTTSIAAYIGDLLRKANWDEVSPELIMTVFGIVTLITIIIATLIVDCIGRRPLLLFSCVGTTITNIALAIYYYVDEYHKEINLVSMRWFPAITIIMFTMFFGIGLGPVTQTIQSELFPNNIRALGNVITSYNLTFTSFVCLRLYQVLIDYLGIYANFLFFAMNTLIAGIVIYLYIPETKGKTFLEINEFFTKDSEKKEIKVKDSKI